MILWTLQGSFEISQLVSTETNTGWQTAATLCIFAGVIGKSAQFPLFSWLPDAMEGPTPVSALIHAATMVAAGVYLLIRIFPLFTPDALTVVSGIGMLTAVIAAISALFQHDIKKILAYSTISQLGLMIMAIGIGVVDAAFLHLLTHAFFKAGLFLAAGSVIHSLHRAQIRSTVHVDVQDIRNMGGLRKQLPTTFHSFVICGASLAGIPFFSGFLSKEAIVASVWMTTGLTSWLVLVTLAIVSFLTVVYTFRLIWFVFAGEERYPLSHAVRNPPDVMLGPAVALAVASFWYIVSPNPFGFTGWIMPAGNYTHLAWITVFSCLWIAAAIVISYIIFRRERLGREVKPFFTMDAFYQRSFGSFTLAGAQAVNFLDKKCIDGIIHGTAYAHVTLAHFAGWFDRTVIDGLVSIFASSVSLLGSFSRSFQGGKIQLYIFWAILTIIIFLISSLI
jgi:NADH-quinone oxidoreductase subunit L